MVLPFHVYLFFSANNIYQSVCTRGYGCWSWLWLLKPKLGKTGSPEYPQFLLISSWRSGSFKHLPFDWGDVHYSPTQLSYNVYYANPFWGKYKSLFFTMAAFWTKMNTPSMFRHIILCYRISFLTFWFLYIKICVRHSDLFPCLQRFELEFFALQFININILKCCLLLQVW